MIDEKIINDAIDRIACTSDGEILYRYLQQVVCETSIPPTDSALREHSGRRRFAADLMGLMAKGIDASGGRNGSERPVILGRREPGDARRKLSAREWLAGQPKWDDDPNYTSTGSAGAGTA
jgi:hypothetical protein